MTNIIQPHRAQRIGMHLEEETLIMYKNLLKKPWVSQAVLNAKKSHMCYYLPRYIKQGRMSVSMMFNWDASPQGWDYWHILNIEN